MKRSPLMSVLLILTGTLGCGRGEGQQDSTAAREEGWSVTAWGQRYEVFAETGPLVIGHRTTSNVHVTVLDGFAPLKQGTVALLLRGEGPEQSFRQEKAKRDGIFPVEIEPRGEGTFGLFFRIDGPNGPEEIPAGRARVGSVGSPGGGETAGEAATTEAVSFLKEQQWRTEFATAWVREGMLHDGVAGPARVTPAANGATTLTASVDATVMADTWPHVGLDLPEGTVVFQLVPRVSGRSLPELEADAASLEAEVETARRRVERLTDLLRVEATSAAEVERGRTALAGLEARLQAARSGVSTTTGSEQKPPAIPVLAPWAGTVAEVFVSPCQTVGAGTALARLVKTRPLWFVLALRPEDASRVREAPSGLVIRRPGFSEPLEVSDDLRIISRSPELDPRTGTVDVIVEARQGVQDLPLGSTVGAELLLAGVRRGIVVPGSALVDDAGITVAYVQLEGETFARREVRVLVRQGADALVEGVQAGDRLVTRGGAAIRRSALLTSGAPEGHVH